MWGLKCVVTVEYIDWFLASEKLIFNWNFFSHIKSQWNQQYLQFVAPIWFELSFDSQIWTNNELCLLIWIFLSMEQWDTFQSLCEVLILSTYCCLSLGIITRFIVIVFIFFSTFSTAWISWSTTILYWLTFGIHSCVIAFFIYSVSLLASRSWSICLIVNCPRS